MPGRYLREGICDSDAVNALSFPEEVFYRRLMSFVDDFGRYDGRASVLRGRLYALKLDSVREADVVRWIAACEKANLIALYHVNGKPYILFGKLGEARAKASKYPPPPPELEERLNLATHLHADVNICSQTHADAPLNDSEQRTASNDNEQRTTSTVTPRNAGVLVTPADEFLKAWNELPEPFPEILKIDGKRLKAFEARYRDPFWRDNWRAALAALPERSFLRGEGERGWVADADFFLKSDSVQKIIEGKYIDGPGKNGTLKNNMLDGMEQFLANGSNHDDAH